MILKGGLNNRKLAQMKTIRKTKLDKERNSTAGNEVNSRKHIIREI